MRLNVENLLSFKTYLANKVFQKNLEKIQWLRSGTNWMRINAISVNLVVAAMLQRSLSSHMHAFTVIVSPDPLIPGLLGSKLSVMPGLGFCFSKHFLRLFLTSSRVNKFLLASFKIHILAPGSLLAPPCDSDSLLIQPAAMCTSISKKQQHYCIVAKFVKIHIF